MQTDRKTLVPATDQGNAVQLMTTDEVARTGHGSLTEEENALGSQALTFHRG